MPVLETLYTGALAERARHERWDQPCTTTLLVCVPPGVTDMPAVREQLARTQPAGHTEPGQTALDPQHFPLWRCPDAIETNLLIGPNTDARQTGLAHCAGGPIGLLDLGTTATRTGDLALAIQERWSATVAHTGPAHGWWTYLDRHHENPEQYPLSTALAEFASQPRVTAMLAHDAATDRADRFPADCYGPGLEALQAGAASYADHLAGVLTYGGGLLTLDRHLLVPSWTDVLVEQSWPERLAYHQQAQAYLARTDPASVLVAVRCRR